MTPVDRIIEAFEGQTALARALNTTQSTIWGWKKRGFVPSSRIPEVIRAAALLTPPVLLKTEDFFDLSAGEAA